MLEISRSYPIVIPSGPITSASPGADGEDGATVFLNTVGSPAVITLATDQLLGFANLDAGMAEAGDVIIWNSVLKLSAGCNYIGSIYHKFGDTTVNVCNINDYDGYSPPSMNSELPIYTDIASGVPGKLIELRTEILFISTGSQLCTSWYKFHASPTSEYISMVKDAVENAVNAITFQFRANVDVVSGTVTGLYTYAYLLKYSASVPIK